MPVGTYSEILQEAAEWLGRDDLTSQMSDFLRIAETKLQRDLRLPAQEITSTGTLTAGQDYLAVPAGTEFVRHLRLDLAAGIRVLHVVEPVAFAAVRDADDTGIPSVMYHSGDRIYLAATPGDAHPYTMIRRGPFSPVLSGSNETSWLTLNAGETLHLGTLLEAVSYLGGDEREQRWMADYERQREALRIVAWNLRAGGGPLRARGDGPTP